MPIIHQETFAEQCDKLPKLKLDLETLKFVKFSFEIHSDWQSTHNHGYDALCRIIKEEENKIECDQTENKQDEFAKV